MKRQQFFNRINHFLFVDIDFYFVYVIHNFVINFFFLFKEFKENNINFDSLKKYFIWGIKMIICQVINILNKIYKLGLKKNIIF
jgi:hypothetical protein